MRKVKLKAKQKEEKEDPSAEQPMMDETPLTESTEVESIEDFIELKRLQNRILGKLIDNLNQSEDSKKTTNKQT